MRDWWRLLRRAARIVRMRLTRKRRQLRIAELELSLGFDDSHATLELALPTPATLLPGTVFDILDRTALPSFYSNWAEADRQRKTSREIRALHRIREHIARSQMSELAELREEITA